MNAFQRVIAQCPWLPVIGNHESTSGAGGDKVDASAEEHYLNQTWGIVMDSTDTSTVSVSSTATTGLGHLLTRSTAFSAGSHGHTPSRTSQWAAVDIGLIHFAVLDLDPGPPPIFAGAQAAWLEADLIKATANRDNVPWIVVGSHFPLYAGRLDEAGALDASLVWYDSERSEGERGAKPWKELPSFTSCSKEQHRYSALLITFTHVFTYLLTYLLTHLLTYLLPHLRTYLPQFGELHDGR